VAAALCGASLGTDTGGSIRQPAAFCGCVGIKPTYGRVSRWGVVAFASSLDQVGPLTRTVADAALLLEVICGSDPHDATSLEEPVPEFRKALTGDIAGLRVGIPAEYFSGAIDDEVRSAVQRAAAILQEKGAELIDISLPHTNNSARCCTSTRPARSRRPPPPMRHAQPATQARCTACRSRTRTSSSRANCRPPRGPR
jgi:aspartyl-tRNA(Asn)/glutamyl-tRNA(Gln) amidotransferase subunit A